MKKQNHPKEYLLKVYVCLISLICFGCSNPPNENLPAEFQNLKNLMIYPENAEPSHTIELVRDQIFGDTEEVFIGRMAEVAVDKIGRVYIADSQELDVKVYNPDGSLLRRFGRQGQGPGEFSRGVTDLQVTGNSLFAGDRSMRRINVFSIDALNYENTVIIDYGEYSVRSNGTFLVYDIETSMVENMNIWDKFETTSSFYFLDSNGSLMSEKLMEMKASRGVMLPFQGRAMSRTFLFYGSLLRFLSEDDHLYLAWSEDFLIKVYNPEGEYQHAIYYPIEKAPLELASAIEPGMLEFIESQNGIEFMDIPTAWPALGTMLVDDESRIWVSTIVEDAEIYEWWILEDTGELIAKFQWPRDEPIELIKNSYIYSRGTNEETGIENIVRYRLMLQEN